MAAGNGSLNIRAKKLGIYLREARLNANEPAVRLAEAAGLSEAELDALEMGDRAPTLPELELLASALELTVEQLMGSAPPPETVVRKKSDPKRLSSVRRRKIGAQLRHLRLERGLMLEELAPVVKLDTESLEQMELGETALPVPVLEKLAAALDCSLKDFEDPQTAARAARKKALAEFQALPPELQAFITRPYNRPYLDLAMRMSEMSVDKLRQIAEVLLEITF